MTQIPIQNIYYLLSYAWDKLDQAEITSAGISDFNETANLLGKVLANGCSYLFKLGLYRNYQEVQEEIPGIRGRLMMDQSLKKLSFHNKKAWCRYDELSHNVLPNQILKTTLLRLLYLEEIEKELHQELKELYTKFSEVQDINLQFHHFNKIHIHRNNAFYGFLLQICRLIFESSAIKESGSSYQFRDFTRDEKKMASLFEAFVFNFYQKEQSRYTVYSPQINWPFKSGVEKHDKLLPTMQTDIVLEDDGRIIIIDAKFYKETLARRSDYGTTSFKSPNMYQVFAYMQHINNPKNKKVEGVLLYPDVGDSINVTYRWEGQLLTFKTLDLDRGWQKVEYDLLALVK